MSVLNVDVLLIFIHAVEEGPTSVCQRLATSKGAAESSDCAEVPQRHGGTYCSAFGCMSSDRATLPLLHCVPSPHLSATNWEPTGFSTHKNAWTFLCVALILWSGCVPVVWSCVIESCAGISLQVAHCWCVVSSYCRTSLCSVVGTTAHPSSGQRWLSWTSPETAFHQQLGQHWWGRKGGGGEGNMVRICIVVILKWSLSSMSLPMLGTASCLEDPWLKPQLFVWGHWWPEGVLVNPDPDDVRSL